jgi:hypothetical protein
MSDAAGTISGLCPEWVKTRRRTGCDHDHVHGRWQVLHLEKHWSAVQYEELLIMPHFSAAGGTVLAYVVRVRPAPVPGPTGDLHAWCVFARAGDARRGGVVHRSAVSVYGCAADVSDRTAAFGPGSPRASRRSCCSPWASAAGLMPPSRGAGIRLADGVVAGVQQPGAARGCAEVGQSGEYERIG